MERLTDRKDLSEAIELLSIDVSVRFCMETSPSLSLNARALTVDDDLQSHRSGTHLLFHLRSCFPGY